MAANTTNTIVAPNQAAPALTSHTTFTQAWYTFHQRVAALLSGESVFTIGDIKLVADGLAHEDWLICNGQTVRIVDYPDLYADITTKYGAQPNAATFLLPNLASPGAPSVYLIKAK